MKSILVVEDDAALGKGICLALQGGDYALTLCGSLAGANAARQAHAYDLFLLDINLPDGCGLDFLQAVHRERTAPVILLTANDLESDIVTGLELGADDYITKPFSLAVLRARVNARLRAVPAEASCFTQGCYRFDFTRMEFFKRNQPVELSKTEQKLLRLLVENRGATLPRALLTDRLWDVAGAAYVDENALSVTVKRLRDKLEDSPSHPTCIKTIYGIGYTWAVTP